MTHLVRMPKLGLTMTEGRLASWLVEVGSQVAESDPLFEVETDKVTSEVCSPAAGILLRRVDAGVHVPVGAPVAVLGEKGQDVSQLALFDSTGGHEG